MRALEVRGDQLVEALLGGIEQVAPFAGGHPALLTEQVKLVPSLAGEGDEGFAVVAAGDVALKNLAADFGAQAFRGVLAAAVGRNDLMGFRRSVAMARPIPRLAPVTIAVGFTLEVYRVIEYEGQAGLGRNF